MEQIQLQLPLRIAHCSSDLSIACAPEEEQRQRQQQEQQGPSCTKMYNKSGSGSGSVSSFASSARDTSNMSRISHRSSSNTQFQGTPSSVPVTYTKFEAVTAHTAKCDLCNTRNDSGMSRCQSCGWQSCHACTISKGCTRTHNAGSRTHTGPIDRALLVSLPKSKGKKKGQGRSKSQPMRVSKRGRGPDRPQLRTRGGACRKVNTPNPSFDDLRQQSLSSTSNGPSSTVDRDFFEDEKYFEGVRDLYAFSLEAYGIWANDQRDRNPAQRWSYHAVRLEELHAHALFSATRAVLELRMQEAAKDSRVW